MIAATLIEGCGCDLCEQEREELNGWCDARYAAYLDEADARDLSLSDDRSAA